jgi:hypothetical protein
MKDTSAAADSDEEIQHILDDLNASLFQLIRTTD